MTATQILDAIKAEHAANGTDTFGIRRLHTDEPSAIGARLANSWVWDDGDITDEQLDGTCAASIHRLNLASVEQAIAWISAYRFDHCERLALICGTQASSHDTLEAGATIIHNAEIMLVW